MVLAVGRGETKNGLGGHQPSRPLYFMASLAAADWLGNRL